MEHLVLYRKYRPKTFSEIAGQEHIVRTLTNALVLNRLAHAYLFTGPRGTGKTTVARLLAKAVNCEKKQCHLEQVCHSDPRFNRGEESRRKTADVVKPRDSSALPQNDYEPCNQCPSCQEINQGNSLDLIEIDAASNRGIDEIRELKEGIKFAPSRLKFKVFVVDECLTGEHFVAMSDGTVREISKVKNGDSISSVDLNTGRIINKKIENYFVRKTNKIIKVKTSQGIMRCTPTHRLWVLREGRIQLLIASRLKETDYLLSPVYFPHVVKNSLRPEQLSFISLIQCDGHVSKDSNTIQVEVKKDRLYFESVIKKGLKSLGIKEKVVIRKTKRNTTLFRIFSKDLKKILEDFNCPSGNKHNIVDINDRVFQAPLKSIKAYIDTCFCCEGDASCQKSNNLSKLSLGMTSRSFVYKLQLLLKKFGINSGLMEICRKDKRYSKIYRLNLTGYNLRLFQEKIGLSLKRKNNILKKQLLKKEKQDSIPIQKLILNLKRKHNLSCEKLRKSGIYLASDQRLTRRTVEKFIKLTKLSEINKFLKFFYIPVRKIEIQETKESVYDFTVPKTHTFLINTICSSNCHMLTPPAFNALLKTLEEPPAHAIFILATTEARKVPQTIISRCQRFDFHKLPLEKIVSRLAFIAAKEKIKISQPALELIALNADGCVRDGESLLGQIMSMEDKEITLEEVQTILGVADIKAVADLAGFLAEKNSAKAIGHINQLVSDGYDLVQFSKSMVNYLRKAMLLKVDANLAGLVASELTKEQLSDIIERGARFSAGDLVKLIYLFVQAGLETKSADFPQLPLELAVVEWCG